MATKAQKAGGKKRAPIRKAKNYMKEAPGIALRMLMYVVVTVVLGLLFSMVQGIETLWLRRGITGIVALTTAFFFFTEGSGRGGADANASRQIAKLEKEGKTITAKEDASCYHPLKAVLGMVLLYALPLALAVILALRTEEYTYTLQDLPLWVTGSYGGREDVMGALGAYAQVSAGTPLEWVRVIVRLFVLIFINLFENPQLAVAAVDRSAPLFILLYPIAFVLGYLRGPSEQAKMEKANKKAKKVAVRKQQRSSLVEELTGNVNAPHYGHKREEDKPKKKELV